VSFKHKGKRVSISETPAGIAVKLDGKTIRAKDLDDLAQKSPEAYELFNERMGSTFAKATARGSAKGAAGGSAGGGAGNMAGNAGESSSRSVSISENGKQITITENDRGITVRANGRAMRARNAAELARRSPEAFRLYNEHFANAAPAMQAGAGPANGNKAQDMLRDQINQMRGEHAGNAQLQGLFDQMLQQIDQQ
jgi:hypothetical protein